MPENSYTPRKHLFTVHSGVTVLMLDLIIKYYNLDPNDIYIISHKNSLQAVLNLNIIPRHRIFVTDHIYAQYQKAKDFPHDDVAAYIKNYYQLYRYILNSVYTLLDSNVDDALKSKTNCQLNRDYFSKDNYDEVVAGTAQPCYEDYSKPTPADYNLDFNLYTQHTSDIIFNMLVQSKHCRCIKYCEEGTINYIDFDDRLFNPYRSSLEFMEENYPQFNYTYLGIKRHTINTLFQLDQLENPNVDLERSGFIGLSNLSFAKNYIDHTWQDGKINLDIITNVASHHITRDANPYYQEQNELYQTNQRILNNQSIQTALQQPEYIGRYVNIVVTENYVPMYTTEEQYLHAHQELIRRVVQQGIFFFFIKFHPLLKPELEQQLIDFLNQQTSCMYRIIPSEVCLEKLFAESVPNSFIVHTITSSVGLYASKFSQITFTYTDLYKDTVCQTGLIERHSFYLQEIIDYFNQENQHNINYISE